MESERAQRFPLWSIALAGWLLASVWRASGDEVQSAGAVESPTLGPRALGHLSARELRALPGLGERRSLALVDARWARAPGDPPLYFGDLAGIGGVVESAVRGALLAGAAEEDDSP